MRLLGIVAVSFGFLFLLDPVLAVRGSRSRGRQISKHERVLQFEEKGKDKSKDDSSKDDTDDANIDIGDIDTEGIVDLITDFGCFSEVATVQVQGKHQPITMKDLQVNDKVLTNDGTYQPVYAFGHRDPVKEATFYQLYMSDYSEPLELTGEHLVYLRGKLSPIRADSVKRGDILKGNTKDVEIVKIHKIKRKGVFNPLTATGKVLVNGIQASSYISMQRGSATVHIQGQTIPLSQHDFVHMALSPLRIVCQGLSASFCRTNIENGIPTYIAYGMGFIKWSEEQHVLLQIVIFIMTLVVLGTCVFLENILGASMAASLAMLGLAVLFTMKAFGVTIRFFKTKVA